VPRAFRSIVDRCFAIRFLFTHVRLASSADRDREEEFREQKALEVRLAREALELQTGGPWMRKHVDGKEDAEADAEAGEESEAVEEKVEEKPEVAPAPAPAKYIPPSQRMSMAAATSGSSGYSSASRRNKAAPEIKNESEFPTLGGLRAK
jgi:hypothetical protein